MGSDLNIGISTAFIGKIRAGTWVYTYNLLKSLLQIDKDNRYTLVNDGGDDGFDLSCERLQFKGGVSGKLNKIVWPNFVLPKSAKKGGLNIIHITNPYGTFRSTGYRNVITVHDITPVLFPETQNRMHVFHHKYILPSILKRADAIITDSENSRQDILRYYRINEKKVRAIYLGVDESYRPASEKSNFVKSIAGPYILNVGTLEPRKNLTTLVRAFRLAKEEGLPHKLVITGIKGWGNTGIETEIKGIGRDVVLAGYVAQEELPSLYSHADLFVYPSLYEGFGLPPLEAMACGTPVITSNISSLPEVVGDAAITVEPTDERKLSEMILKVLGDAELKGSLKKRGIERAKLFSWEKTAEETLKVYKQLEQL